MSMNKKVSTADRIQEAGQRLFNERGYAATSLNDIASELGISKGNLNYHFPTKRDLAERIQQETRQLMRTRRQNHEPGNIADDYVDHLLFTMNIAWNNRFILRELHEFSDSHAERSAEFSADFEELLTLMERLDEAGMFLRNTIVDLPMLTRAIWIVSRYWMDYLRESEGLHEMHWDDQDRGVRHHLAVLWPCLTASAKKEFEAALIRARSNT